MRYFRRAKRIRLRAFEKALAVLRMPNACEALYIRVQCFTMSFAHLLFCTDKTHCCIEPPPSVAVLILTSVSKSNLRVLKLCK
ncbi:hypothetical protein DWQ65_11235 [Treponema phagedenis]|nr:hypothetical protein C5O78_07575 [Treponema phagedenis]QSI00620.1 hypothetical protein DWQ65_11235 [Treponema phagedenis]